MLARLNSARATNAGAQPISQSRLFQKILPKKSIRKSYDVAAISMTS